MAHALRPTKGAVGCLKSFTALVAAVLFRHHVKEVLSHAGFESLVQLFHGAIFTF